MFLILRVQGCRWGGREGVPVRFETRSYLGSNEAGLSSLVVLARSEKKTEEHLLSLMDVVATREYDNYI